MNTKAKKIISLLGVIMLFLVLTIQGFANTSLSPFSGVKATTTIKATEVNIKSNIKSQGFQVIGEYNVAGNKNHTIIAFTRTDLKKVSSSYSDRGALASVLKIGINKSTTGIEVSLLNPNYTFNAYFGDGYDKNKVTLDKINSDAHKIIATFGEVYQFGGEVEISKLRKYKYMLGMPKFTSPVKLETYSNFDTGLATIQKNIKTNKNVKLVYSVIDNKNKTAVFGFALINPSEGEKNFMPTIGERNSAAMPYEVILQGDKATMLHGRYRIALYWPTLSMGTFSKIMSTPGNIEDAMESVTEIK